MVSRLCRDVLQTVAAVALVAAVLFALTGVWPPMVAIESGSMEPHMSKGDLIVVAEPGRLTAAAADGSPIVTARESETDGDGIRLTGAAGDVIVFDPPHWRESPILHRAMFRVERGENWYDRANESHLPPGVENCEQLVHCPAPNDGYITKGDANSHYDQADGLAPPVRPEWIRATAELRVPYLGWIRLLVAGAA